MLLFVCVFRRTVGETIKPCSLVGGENMQLNEDTCESNMHNELKIMYIKEEEPNDDEYLWCCTMTDPVSLHSGTCGGKNCTPWAAFWRSGSPFPESIEKTLTCGNGHNGTHHAHFPVRRASTFSAAVQLKLDDPDLIEKNYGWRQATACYSIRFVENCCHPCRHLFSSSPVQGLWECCGWLRMPLVSCSQPGCTQGKVSLENPEPVKDVDHEPNSTTNGDNQCLC
nr:uncharacterized protein LOC111859298 [Paramormyrops kingsleyae]